MFFEARRNQSFGMEQTFYMMLTMFKRQQKEHESDHPVVNFQLHSVSFSVVATTTGGQKAAWDHVAHYPLKWIFEHCWFFFIAT